MHGYGQKAVSVAVGISVLANYRSAGINAHRDGSDSTGIFNGNWCGAMWELQKPILLARSGG
jgi:hypothetical protein